MSSPLRGGMLALLSALTVSSFAQSATNGWKPAKSPLATRWSKEVSPKNALPEYPRPQMRRKEWLNLNGLWEYGLAFGRTTPVYGGKILVPYPMESALSGVGRPTERDKWLYYRRNFTVPAKWRADANAGRRVMLHFGAVNYLAEMSVNGKPVGSHRGGYDGFSFDVTQALRSGTNEIVVRVQNPLKVDVPDAQVLGKQRVRSEGIFYTAATGIWQTVWMEPVNQMHFREMRITPDVDAGVVTVFAPLAHAESGEGVEIEVTDGGKTIARQRHGAGATMRIPIPKARLWSPSDPHLYGLKLRYRTKAGVTDEIESYFAMRKISLGKDAQGRTTIHLNDKPIFQVGTLDQGYWPDGIYTAPTDGALKWDIEQTKRLGFNMIRKHAKTEPDRFYYWTDKLGLLVWQDMPQAYTPGENTMNEEGERQWETEWREILTELHNHPSIVVWTVFNEGWGQHDTPARTAWTKDLDPTRLVNSASGWFDREAGDLDDVHSYPEPGTDAPSATRAAVNGEFGGITMRVPGHMWAGGEIMGYGTTLTDAWSVTKRYQDLMRQAYALKETRGTCAFVYTQITDVEQEVNGLLTYDRAVWKADPKIVAAANRGVFLPLPPNPNPPILPTGLDQAQTWRYTTEAPASGWNGVAFEDAAWKSGAAPFGAELGGVRTPWSTSEIWLRREVTLPGDLPKELDLLVFHDEDAEIWINGVLAASPKGYVSGYVPIPLSPEARAALRPGKNTIAVHVRQTRGGQYFDLGLVRRPAPPKR